MSNTVQLGSSPGGQWAAFVGWDTQPLYVGQSSHTSKVVNSRVSSGHVGHAAGTGETTTRSLCDNRNRWDRLSYNKKWAGLLCQRPWWNRRRGRHGLGCCAWVHIPLMIIFIVFFFKQQQVIFFSCGPGGCPLPWLFNIPPANKKGSRQQTSALLNGSKANLDPWIRTANQDRSEMQIKLRINQEAIRKCKSQRKRKYDYRLATKWCKGGQSKEMADLPVFRNANEKQYRMQEERKRRALSKVQFAVEGRPQTR